MKFFLTVICLFLSVSLLAQKTEGAKLVAALTEFDLALVSKDSLKLKSILSEKLSYGHSNGWIQNRRQLIDDLFNGKITYKQVRSGEFDISMQKNVAWVRSIADGEAVMDGKTMNFKLKVLQVWVRRKGRWTMFARQSVKY